MKLITVQPLRVYFSINSENRRKKFVNGNEIVNSAAVNGLLKY